MKWRYPLLVGLLSLIVVIAGCTSVPLLPASPTPDRVATRVAEEQAVAATLTAAAPKPAATHPPPPTSPLSLPPALPPTSLPTLPPFSSSASSVFSPSSSSAVPALPTFMLIARHNHGCLTGGSGIGLTGCTGATNQRWQIEIVDAQYAQLSQSGMCLTVKGGSTDDSAPLVQASCTRQANQLWRLDKYGDWIQLVAKHSGKCVDAQQFGVDNVFQWPCRSGNPDNNINDNDNQLWLRSATTTVASSTVPPPGVYVTSIVEEYGQPAPARREYAFKVTFANTIGASQPYRWWVMVKKLDPGPGSGETPKKNESLGPGEYKTELWTIGRGCANYRAQVFWWRDYAEPKEVPFRDPFGKQPSITFNVCF